MAPFIYFVHQQFQESIMCKYLSLYYFQLFIIYLFCWYNISQSTGTAFDVESFLVLIFLFCQVLENPLVLIFESKICNKNVVEQAITMAGYVRIQFQKYSENEKFKSLTILTLFKIIIFHLYFFFFSLETFVDCC